MDFLLGQTVGWQEGLCGFENNAGGPPVRGNAVQARFLVETAWSKAEVQDRQQLS